MSSGGTMGALEQLEGKLRSVGSTAQSAAEQVTAAAEKIDRDAARVATKADDVLVSVQRLADQGNVIAEQVEGVIQHVREGLLHPLEAINAFGDGLTTIDGQVRSIRDLLLDILPSGGEVQARIREMIKELERDGATVEELAARLAQQHNSYARELAELFRLMQANKITLQEFIRRAQQVSQQIPGSETAALAELLLEGLRE